MRLTVQYAQSKFQSYNSILKLNTSYLSIRINRTCN